VPVVSGRVKIEGEVVFMTTDLMIVIRIIIHGGPFRGELCDGFIYALSKIKPLTILFAIDISKQLFIRVQITGLEYESGYNDSKFLFRGVIIDSDNGDRKIRGFYDANLHTGWYEYV
jgi:hypothetical protein